MALPARELLMEVSKLTELQNMRVALKETFKGGCLAGATTMIGGLVFGPPGLAIGGIIGGCAASYMTHNKFKSVAEIIVCDLTLEQKGKLAASIQQCVCALELKDVAQFAVEMAQNPAVAHSVAMAVLAFMQSDMGMKIVD